MRGIPRAAILSWSLLLATTLHAEPDLSRPPTSADKAALIAGGWAAGRDLLAAKLGEKYRPGFSGRPGATGSAAYREWLTLWKWFDLLARDEAREAAAWAARRLFKDPESDKIVFLPLGVPAPVEVSPLPKERLGELLSHPEALTDLLARLLPETMPRPESQPIAARLSPEILQTWIADSAFSEMFFSVLDADDYAPGVLWNLQEIQTAHPAEARAYQALAVAVAIVYDTQWPAFWPHHQVDAKRVPLATMPPAERFMAWVAANESRTLLGDLRRMGPEYLKFVVDAPLAESEFTWARKNAKFPRANFERAFSAVPYKFDRIKSQQFSWDRDAYTLEAILKRGGICVDQAYFAMIAGKARGIPTLFFTGQGSDGGHAWFGYLKSSDRWDMDAGRYENQNYATGFALDPQTWRPISDHDLRALAEGFRRTPAYAAARDDLVLAGLFEEQGNRDLADKATESALGVCPQMPEAWEARGRFLNASGAPPEARRALHEAAIRQFQNRRDQRTRHQEALAAIAREQGDSAAAEQLEKQIISSNRRLRSDLSVNAAAKRLDDLLEGGKTDDAFAEYRRLLNSLKTTGGGNFFYDIVRPFSTALIERGDAKRAREAVDLARRALKPEPGSILDLDFGKLTEEIAR